MGQIDIIKYMQKGDHSLQPDFYTGWKLHPTVAKCNQFPIYFTNPPADLLSKTLTSFGHHQKYRVVYMGPRPTSNFQAFKRYSINFVSKDSNSLEEEMYGEAFTKYEFKFSEEKEKVFPIRPMEYRIFTGMNPTLKKEDLCFDSNFQCGNLDLAILVTPAQYDLLMRVDSNTKGHTSWFYYKVTNFTHKQKITFNLINFQKKGLLYQQGMKPYCYRSSKKIWEQDGSSLEFKPKAFRYSHQDQEQTIMSCLSFNYEFDQQDQFVCFAYCVPYSYSYLMHRVEHIQKENPHYIHLDKSHLSTGGLTIPILTISNSNFISNKPVCLIAGRQHPGETQGSWVLDGFLKYLCSPKGYYLRQRIIFKIIPMVNVDGVVLGNFRTGIAGRDINRVFDQPQKYSQVAILRDIASKFSPLIFLDFHGHSNKKNVFTYGPDYGVQHSLYLLCRIFPKLISKATTAFRYYGCLFKISENKVNTGRAIMLKEHRVSYAYTIESSSHAFGSKNQEVNFNRSHYQSIGQKIAESMSAFVKIVIKIPKRLQNNKQQQKDQNNYKLDYKLDYKTHQYQNTSPLPNPNESISNSNLLCFYPHNQEMSKQQNEMMLELINDYKQTEIINDQKQKEQLKASSKQEYSKHQQPTSDSDFEQGCDYTELQLKSMLQAEKTETSPQKQHLIKRSKKSKHKNDKKQMSHKRNLTTEKSEIAQQIIKSSNVLNPIRQRQRKKRIFEDASHNIESPKPKIKMSDKTDLASVRNPISTELTPSQSFNFNKINYKNWKRVSISPIEINDTDFTKANSVIHINIDYSTEKLYSMVEQERPKLYESKRRQHIKKTLTSEKKLERSLSKNSKEIERQKHLLFPILSKNSQNGIHINSSVLKELLQHSEKSHKYYISEHIKIINS